MKAVELSGEWNRFFKVISLNIKHEIVKYHKRSWNATAKFSYFPFEVLSMSWSLCKGNLLRSASIVIFPASSTQLFEQQLASE